MRLKLKYYYLSNDNRIHELAFDTIIPSIFTYKTPYGTLKSAKLTALLLTYPVRRLLLEVIKNI